MDNQPLQFLQFLCGVADFSNLCNVELFTRCTTLFVRAATPGHMVSDVTNTSICAQGNSNFNNFNIIHLQCSIHAL